MTISISDLFYDDAGPHVIRHATPPAGARGAALREVLSDALQQFAPLGARSAPRDGAVVPVETLLYRGRAALERADALRAEVRRAGLPPTPDVVEELLDLIALAAAE